MVLFGKLTEELVLHSRGKTVSDALEAAAADDRRKSESIPISFLHNAAAARIYIHIQAMCAYDEVSDKKPFHLIGRF